MSERVHGAERSGDFLWERGNCGLPGISVNHDSVLVAVKDKHAALRAVHDGALRALSF